MVEQKGQDGQIISMCSVNCLKVFQMSTKSANNRKHNCDNCRKYLKAMYHLTMSDNSQRHFCSYLCLLTYQSKQPPPQINTSGYRRGARREDIAVKMPIITQVQSLANSNSATTNGNVTEIEKKIRQLVFVKPQPLAAQKNIATMVKPNSRSKGTLTECRGVHKSKVYQFSFYYFSEITCCIAFKR